MKSLVRSLLIIPFFLSCGGEEAEETTTEETEEVVVEEVVEEEVVNSTIIETDVCGIFLIGNEVPNLPEELKMRQFNEIDVNDAGEEVEHMHNVVFNQLEDVVELIMDQGSEEHHEDRMIEEMMVLSNYYETPDGIAVGSTIEDFNLAYPDNKFWYSTVHDWYYVEAVAAERIEFILDAGDVAKKPSGSADKIQMRMDDFAAGAEIKKIRLH
jgi:hypothetical protein